MTSNEAYYLVITGSVQGVLFRHSSKKKALELGLTGWVKNHSDGSVHVIIQGAPSVCQAFIDWSQEGPPSADVSHVHVTSHSYNDRLFSFEITA